MLQSKMSHSDRNLQPRIVATTRLNLHFLKFRIMYRTFLYSVSINERNVSSYDMEYDMIS